MTDEPTLVERIEQVRAHFNEGLPMTRWNGEAWLGAVMVQMGRAAQNLHHMATPSENEIGICNLLAVAALCMDAVDSLEEQEPGLREGALARAQSV